MDRCVGISLWVDGRARFSLASIISGGGDLDAIVPREMLCIDSDPKDILDSVGGRSAATPLGRVGRQLTGKRLANSCKRALGCR